jgi:prepilin-type N-terminal cleavage/methylation domain-containing protein
MEVKKVRDRGLTLIETIAAIVVAAIGASGFVSLYLSATDGHSRVETRTVGCFLAQGLMDEVRSKRFDENHVAPFSVNLGTDMSENGGDKTTFDDVDDFGGWSETPSGFEAYVLSVSVEYVRERNLDQGSSSPTRFKRIVVEAALGEETVAELKTIASGW